MINIIKFYLKKIIRYQIKKISKLSKIFQDEIINLYEIKINNIKIIFSPSNDITYRRWIKFEKDGKEKNTMDFINTFEEKDIFFDIGANVGVFSLYAALKKNVKVYAFEPEVTNFINLVKTINLNNADVIPILIPLSDKNKAGYFNYKNTLEAGYSMHQFKIEAEKDKINYLTLSTSLNALIEEKKLPFPNYIKLDVDGIELDILYGMEEILKNDSLKAIIVELNNKNEEKIVNEYLNKFDLKFQQGPTGFNRNFVYSKNEK